MDSLYFAYGSNMDSKQMAERCPGAKAVGTGVLQDYRFIINQRGFATLRLEAGASTPGVLWALSPAHEKTLDQREGYREGLYDKSFRSVRRDTGEEVQVLVYIDHRNQRIETPRDGYLERVIAGAESHGLPADHLRMLRAWPRKRTIRCFNRLVNEVKSGASLTAETQRHGAGCVQVIKAARDRLIVEALDHCRDGRYSGDFETNLSEVVRKMAEELARQAENTAQEKHSHEIVKLERFINHAKALREDDGLLDELNAYASARETGGDLGYGDIGAENIIITQYPERTGHPEDRIIVTPHAGILQALWSKLFSGKYDICVGGFIKIFAEAVEQHAKDPGARDLIRQVLDGAARKAAIERENLLLDRDRYYGLF
ncbi:MAG: gamma-glutamylcyclotransferase family protein [Candidatus Hydrogenedentales bacterium]|jgi:cation transport regulator ChaC